MEKNVLAVNSVTPETNDYIQIQPKINYAFQLNSNGGY